MSHVVFLLPGMMSNELLSSIAASRKPMAGPITYPRAWAPLIHAMIFVRSWSSVAPASQVPCIQRRTRTFTCVHGHIYTPLLKDAGHRQTSHAQKWRKTRVTGSVKAEDRSVGRSDAHQKAREGQVDAWGVHTPMSVCRYIICARPALAFTHRMNPLNPVSAEIPTLTPVAKHLPIITAIAVRAEKCSAESHPPNSNTSSHMPVAHCAGIMRGL